MVSLPETLVDLEQHLIAQACLLQIFQFAGHGYKVKRKASRITSQCNKVQEQKKKRETTVTTKTLKTVQELLGLNPCIMVVLQFVEALQ